jgi:anaerobic magnesium-protoporphyrin IX monomethyl ester cyclase
MKNVGFVNPPSEFLINQRVFVTLGILRVATHLDKQGICKVYFLDLSNRVNYKELLINFISDNSLDVICFTATTPQIATVYNLCTGIRSMFRGKIILGGPHITLMYGSIKQGTPDIQKICQDHINTLLGCIDTIIIGDGEYAIIDAINQNVAIIDSEQDKRLFLKRNYDEVTIPDRSFLDLSSYEYYIDGVKSTNIISQMGCPYQCEFCSGRGSKTFSTVRKRSVGNIIKEIDFLYKQYGYKGFMCYDDELNINRKYFEDLLVALIDYQKQNNVSFNLRGFTRSDLLTEGQADLMYRAGFRWLLVGFESGSDKILRNINKGCTVEDNTRCFDIARKSGLKVKALMSIGHAGESFYTISDTITWLKDVKPDETDTTIISVYPGANYFNKAVRMNNSWLKYTSKTSGDNLYIKDIDFLSDSNFYKSKSDEIGRAHV